MAQITTNENFLESRNRVGRYASLGGLGVIFAGLLASFQNQYLWAYAALLVGFVLSNVGAYFLNRFGLRAHEKVATALKGLDKRYRLYNFLLPAPNVLLTPYGVTVFLIKHQDGVIMADARGWRQPSGFLGSIVRLTRAFSAEPLGNPPSDLEAQEEKMRAFIQSDLGATFQAPVDGYIVFTNPRADVQLSDISAPVLALATSPDALKNALRRDKRTAQLSKNEYDQLAALFEKEAEAKLNQPHGLLSVLRR